MTHKYPIDLEISPIAMLVWTPDPSGQKGLGSRLYLGITCANKLQPFLQPGLHMHD